MSRENGTLRLGSGLTYTEAMGLAEPLLALAEASRTVGGPQIRNRGTIGGNLGTASPAGDALPPLLVYGAEVELASTRGSRTCRCASSSSARSGTPLEQDELIVAVRVPVPGPRQTFMKVGPRNAMVIAVVSLALVVDGDELRASYGSAGPVPGLVTAPVEERDTFPEQVAEAASPIDDVRGTAALPPARAARPHRAGARTEPAREDRAQRQRRAARDRDLGRREPALRPARAARPARLEERVRAGRVRLVLGAARRDARLRVPGARAQADGHEVVTVEGLGRTTASCIRCSRRSARPARCSAASARRG